MSAFVTSVIFKFLQGEDAGSYCILTGPTEKNLLFTTNQHKEPFYLPISIEMVNTINLHATLNYSALVS